MIISSRLRNSIAVCGLILVTGWAYLGGLSGDFIFDDEANIRKNPALFHEALTPEALRQAALSGISGPLKRPLSMMSFAIGIRVHGLEALPLKLTNLFIHILTGLSAGLLAYLLLAQTSLTTERRQWAALACAAIWLLHPFNLSPVLYIVQRMTSLSTLFVIWGVISYVYGRSRQRGGCRSWPYLLVATPVCWLLATLSKENGALLPVFLLVTEWTLFRFEGATAQSRRLLRVYFLILLGVPLVWLIYFLVNHPDWLTNIYANKEFTLSERLMTEGRVVLWYLRMTVVPVISEMGLQHDDIALSRSLFEPLTTLLSLLTVLVLVLSAVAIRMRAPIFSFTILWYFGGHLLESTLLPLEITFEHRNYLPAFGIVFGVSYYLIKPWHAQTWVPIQYTLVVGAISFLTFSTYLRANDWSDPLRFTRTELAHHPDSPRNNYYAAMALLTRADVIPDPSMSDIHRAQVYLQRAITLRPPMASATIALVCSQLDFQGRLAVAEIVRLKQQLQQYVLTPSSLNSMDLLINCARRHDALLTKQIYVSVIDAALKNPRITPRQRSLVLTKTSTFLGQHYRDFDAAIEYASQAVTNAPQHVGNRILKATWQLLNQEYADALHELETADRWDTHSIHQPRIRELRATAEALIQNPGLAPTLNFGAQ